MLSRQGQLRTTDLELKPDVRASAELHIELPCRMTLQASKSRFFGDWVGIADWSGIRVMSNHSCLELCPIAVALSCLESMSANCVAESQGGLGDRGHEEGLPQCMFEFKAGHIRELGGQNCSDHISGGGLRG